MLTKNDLLKEIQTAIDNKCSLMLKAGDYFTDYVKIINPYSLVNFKVEVEEYSDTFAEGDEENTCVKVNSVDNCYFGGYTEDINQYFIFKAKAVLTEELESILSLVD